MNSLNENNDLNKKFESYSSGTSDHGMFEIQIDNLTNGQVRQRIKYLWKLAFKKAVAAAKVVRNHVFYNHQIYTSGYNSKKSIKYFKNEESEESW